MNDVGVIDVFFQTYTRYLDSGFGLVRGDVASLANILVVLDVTLAALFWSLSAGEDILARLIRKTLYVGFFAFLIGNFGMLADVIFQSFAGLGLKAGGGDLSAGDLLRPGRIASAGVEAGAPLLDAAKQLGGFPEVFNNLIEIALLLGCFGVVVVAFFVMAVQLFVVLIEFKLTTLGAFVLVPFGLFGHTAFLAERALGAVVASGVKVMALGVITGIGAGLFDEFVRQVDGQPSIDEVMAMSVAAMTLLGLCLFAPSIATGLASGAPQLGAGSVAGTGALVAGGVLAGAAGIGALRAGAAGASAAFGARRAAPAAASAASTGSARSASASAGGGGKSEAAPAWAQQLRRRHAAGEAASAAMHAARSGDSGGGSTQVSLKENDR
ncbi:P-type conjugative transfer protein TrbL [Caulobacter segnis]|uniref:P-type conjugative transfer protein TrbL n=1 Tax=Caulobacter segnis TaxID=88688 RepID=UPI00241052B3|nr:P-type conjugative transfer protein TrbL [Caulobacter segnis]MDG2522892.1 P-type conjugative transfer protein TrbL [Caulobacter segnis]